MHIMYFAEAVLPLTSQSLSLCGFIKGQGQGQGFFICHIIVIQGIIRSEM